MEKPVTKVSYMQVHIQKHIESVIIYWKTSFLIKHFLFLVHPCDEANNGGCSQICNKRNETHECSCESGFILEEDKATCQKGWLRYSA